MTTTPHSCPSLKKTRLPQSPDSRTAPTRSDRPACGRPSKGRRDTACGDATPWYEDDQGRLHHLYSTRCAACATCGPRVGSAWVKPARNVAATAPPDLVREIRSGTVVVFVACTRIYQHPDLVMPLQTISYDRTVVIDTSGKTEDAILASCPSLVSARSAPA